MYMYIRIYLHVSHAYFLYLHMFMNISLSWVSSSFEPPKSSQVSESFTRSSANDYQSAIEAMAQSKVRGLVYQRLPSNKSDMFHLFPIKVYKSIIFASHKSPFFLQVYPPSVAIWHHSHERSPWSPSPRWGLWKNLAPRCTLAMENGEKTCRKMPRKGANFTKKSRRHTHMNIYWYFYIDMYICIYVYTHVMGIFTNGYDFFWYCNSCDFAGWRVDTTGWWDGMYNQYTFWR